MAFMEVPKDLSKVKTKIALGLTKRQLIGFGSASAIGIPVYLLCRKAGLPDEIGMTALVIMSAPFILLGMYEKDGLPAEELLRSFLIYNVLKPKIRRYTITPQSTKGKEVSKDGKKQKSDK